MFLSPITITHSTDFQTTQDDYQVSLTELMTDSDPLDSFLSIRTQNYYDKYANEILIALNERDKTAPELSEEIGLSSSILIRVLAKLENEGFIESYPVRAMDRHRIRRDRPRIYYKRTGKKRPVKFILNPLKWLPRLRPLYDPQ